MYSSFKSLLNNGGFLVNKHHQKNSGLAQKKNTTEIPNTTISQFDLQILTKANDLREVNALCLSYWL